MPGEELALSIITAAVELSALIGPFLPHREQLGRLAAKAHRRIRFVIAIVTVWLIRHVCECRVAFALVVARQRTSIGRTTSRSRSESECVVRV